MRFQSAQAAHAEQQFLVHANAAIAAVQTRSHLAVFGSIAFHVGIEKKQIAAADFHAPHFGVDRPMAGVDLHHDRPCRSSRSPFPSASWLTSVSRYSSCCQPVAIEALAKISLAIEQADADQRDS